jgi:hypothetical protein
MPPATRPYHAGDLRPALLRAAVETSRSRSRRDEPAGGHRRAGVTTRPPRITSGTRPGCSRAIAAEGYRELGEALREAAEARRGFLEMGVAYVRFAVSHRAHFEVMYRPELYRPEDPEVSRARADAAALLYGTTSPDAGQLVAGAAAWSLVHGLATLWLNGNLPEALGHDPEEITRIVAPHLDVGRR